MSAIDLIRDVYAFGGRLVLEDGHLVVEANDPLPDELVAALAGEKPAVMIALGAPFDVAIGQILDEIRPHLPPAMRTLSDSKLLAMVNWSIMAAWNKAISSLVEHRQGTKD